MDCDPEKQKLKEIDIFEPAKKKYTLNNFNLKPFCPCKKYQFLTLQSVYYIMLYHFAVGVSASAIKLFIWSTGCEFNEINELWKWLSALAVDHETKNTKKKRKK